MAETSESVVEKTHLRYADLVARGFVSNWPTLMRWIKQEGFPPGFKIGNTRLWLLSEILEWFETRRVILAAS